MDQAEQLADRFPPHVLRQYALLADGERGVVVGPRGDYCLMSLPHWHSGESTRFERNRTACGPPGLFAEEFDVEQRQLRGNLPQAFVHALMLETAHRIAGPVPDGLVT